MGKFEADNQHRQNLYLAMLEANKHIASALRILDRSKPASVSLLRNSIQILNESFTQWQNMQQ